MLLQSHQVFSRLPVPPGFQAVLNSASTTPEITSILSFQCLFCLHKPFKGKKCLNNHICNKHQTTRNSLSATAKKKFINYFLFLFYRDVIDFD